MILNHTVPAWTMGQTIFASVVCMSLYLWLVWASRKQ
jgi:hypothetical protein